MVRGSGRGLAGPREEESAEDTPLRVRWARPYRSGFSVFLILSLRVNFYSDSPWTIFRFRGLCSFDDSLISKVNQFRRALHSDLSFFITLSVLLDCTSSVENNLTLYTSSESDEENGL